MPRVPPLLTPLIEGTDMYSTPTLATRFARNTRVLRAEAPLSEDQMRGAAPSSGAEPCFARIDSPSALVSR